MAALVVQTLPVIPGGLAPPKTWAPLEVMEVIFLWGIQTANDELTLVGFGERLWVSRNVTQNHWLIGDYMRLAVLSLAYQGVRLEVVVTILSKLVYFTYFRIFLRDASYPTYFYKCSY